MTAITTFEGMNGLTKGSVIVLILITLFGSLIGGILVSLVIFFWFAPWAADFAIEHRRSKEWAYFYVFLGGLIALLIYWIYVKATKDPQ